MPLDRCPKCGKLLVHFGGYSLCMQCAEQNLTQGIPEFSSEGIFMKWANESHLCAQCHSADSILNGSGLCFKCYLKQTREMLLGNFPGLRAMAMGSVTRTYCTLMPHTPKQPRSSCE